MSLEVIGAGFGRTGTLTLKIALEILGFQRCYHMIEVIHSPPKVADTWLDAISGKIPDWDNVFQGFRAAVDWPVIHFLPELIEKYPETKVILTERDPHSWYESTRKTLFEAMQKVENRWMPKYQKLGYELIINKTFMGITDNKTHAINIYNSHITWVKQNVPKERLISFDVARGWGDLCNFLSLPVPQAPFPHKNTTSEFQRNFIDL